MKIVLFLSLLVSGSCLFATINAFAGSPKDPSMSCDFASEIILDHANLQKIKASDKSLNELCDTLDFVADELVQACETIAQNKCQN